jgi:hypothetical protein
LGNPSRTETGIGILFLVRGGKLKQDAKTFLESTAFLHMWRQTLVRDLYVRDIPIRQIADILGMSLLRSQSTTLDSISCAKGRQWQP